MIWNAKEINKSIIVHLFLYWTSAKYYTFLINNTTEDTDSFCQMPWDTHNIYAAWYTSLNVSGLSRTLCTEELALPIKYYCEETGVLLISPFKIA